MLANHYWLNMAISKNESQKSWQILLDRFKKKSSKLEVDFFGKF
jgi:hypothetical protein